jgi:hypothetical protein
VAVLSMSKQEFSRLEVLLRVQSGRLRISDACVLIGLQRRQLFRLLRGLKRESATGLVSKRRGRPSNHRLLLRFAPWRCRSCASDTPTLARAWQHRGWQSIGDDAQGSEFRDELSSFLEAASMPVF